MKIYIYSLFLLFILTSCEGYNCDGIDCFTPPPSFSFEIIDAQTNENLFSNGTYNENQIQIYNTQTNDLIKYSLDNHIINVFSLGWKTERVNATVKIGEVVIFNFIVDAEIVNENCCSFTRIHEFKVENINYELNNFNPYSVSILVEN